MDVELNLIGVMHHDVIYLGFKIISNISVIFFKPFISVKISSRRVYQRPAALRRQYRVGLSGWSSDNLRKRTR